MTTIWYPMRGGEPIVTINVRRLDEDVVAHLKWRASLNNLSLEGDARHNLEFAADATAAKQAAFRGAMELLRPLTERRKQTPAEVLIREDRDRGHRDNF